MITSIGQNWLNKKNPFEYIVHSPLKRGRNNNFVSLPHLYSQWKQVTRLCSYFFPWKIRLSCNILLAFLQDSRPSWTRVVKTLLASTRMQHIICSLCKKITPIKIWWTWLILIALIHFNLKKIENLWNALIAKRNYWSHFFGSIFHFRLFNCPVENTYAYFERSPH